MRYHPAAEAPAAASRRLYVWRTRVSASHQALRTGDRADRPGLREASHTPEQAPLPIPGTNEHILNLNCGIRVQAIGLVRPRGGNTIPKACIRGKPGERKSTTLHLLTL